MTDTFVRELPRPSGSASASSLATPAGLPWRRERTGRALRAQLGSALRLLGPLALFGLAVLGVTTLSRLGLVVWQRERVEAVHGLAAVFASGLRMDLLALGTIGLPLVVGSLALRGTRRFDRVWSAVLRVLLTAFFGAFAFMEAATPSFVAEFDARPNRIFVEYLGHPIEVFGTLGREHPLELLLAAGVLVAGLGFSWRWYGRLLEEPGSASARSRILVGLIVVPIVFLAARSSLKPRPANPSSVAFSSDHLVNDLCIPSAYSVLYAVYRLKDEADAGELYGKMPIERAVELVRAEMVTVAPEDFTDPERPTLHVQPVAGAQDRPRNLVIVLEESLGAQYSAALGGLGVTPRLDELRAEGWWFENLYATGTRSVRGIEAVMTGFLPTPARAVVKLGAAQTGFFTLAALLADRGYHTQFIYGGDSSFDNMRGFLSGNGVDEIVDEDDFEHPRFHGTWGVCDEDVFAKAHATFLENGDEPFFALVFSVSNHSPFEFPAGGFELHEEPASTRTNGVKYADHALGAFFDVARTAPYWDDTVFLVVADHDSRVHGADLIPVEHFHIPGVILGAGVEPHVDPRLTSQIDLAPTLLSLIGVGGEHPMVGRDLTRMDPDRPGRAILQYGSSQAYMRGTDVLVLRPDREPRQFSYRGGRLDAAPLNAALAECALGHAVLASWLYRERRYGLPVRG